MRPKLVRALPVAVVASLVVVATGLAAGPRAGSYAGTTAQRNPDNHNRLFPVHFRLSHGRIDRVSIVSRDTCPSGGHLQVTQNAFGSAKLDRRGRFTLSAGPKGQRAVLRGRVRGSTASGTLTDATFDKDYGGGLCKGRTTWHAKLVVHRRRHK